MARILVLNMHPGEAAMLAQGLGAMGFQVTTVPSALEARVALRKSLFQAVVVDSELADLDPFAFMETAGDTMKGIPAILTTAYPEAETVRRAVASGFLAILAKPFHLAELGARIRSLIGPDGD